MAARSPAPAADSRRRAVAEVNLAVINPIALYPLRFEPIYQYRLWGGRRLASLLSAPLPGDGPVGEAWILSDRDDHPSLVADGPLKGRTIAQLLGQYQGELLGRLAGRFPRFPLLLKFLDVRTRLSVQVHPSDSEIEFLPQGETGKTEAWVVLEDEPESRIYVGLKPSTTATDLRAAISNGKAEDYLTSFTPHLGDSILVRAGTVHSLKDVVVFEVQENSDVTFRIYDWDHVDPMTGKRRALQVDQGLACIDFTQVAVDPVAPVVEETTPILRERLLHCDHFGVWRIRGEAPFTVGMADTPSVLVCLAGKGQLEHGDAKYDFGNGDVVLLPAVVGACLCRPLGAVNLLEVSLPDSP